MRPFPDSEYSGDVGWVEGKNGGPLPRKFIVTSYLNQSSGWPAIFLKPTKTLYIVYIKDFSV